MCAEFGPISFIQYSQILLQNKQSTRKKTIKQSYILSCTIENSVNVFPILFRAFSCNTEAHHQSISQDCQLLFLGHQVRSNPIHKDLSIRDKTLYHTIANEINARMTIINFNTMNSHRSNLITISERIVHFGSFSTL